MILASLVEWKLAITTPACPSLQGQAALPHSVRKGPAFPSGPLWIGGCASCSESRKTHQFGVISYLREGGFKSSLEKLERQRGRPKHQYSLWDHHPNLRLVTTEDGLIEKAAYIHMSPVRDGLVERPEDYRFSSVRFWQRKPLEDEPLVVDLDEIDWRKR